MSEKEHDHSQLVLIRREWMAILSYARKIMIQIFGLFVLSTGIFLTIQANIGLAPWDALSMGINNFTPLTYGQIVILTGLIILMINTGLKEKIGIGTVLNTLLIGVFVDGLQSLNVFPEMESFLGGCIVLVIGQFILCIGTYYYIGVGLGGGPRDSLMIGLGKRFPNVPIGLIRGLIEGTVLFIGWLLGAKIGIGTVISVFGIGFLLEFTFKLFHFDVKSIEHESVQDVIQKTFTRSLPKLDEEGKQL